MSADTDPGVSATGTDDPPAETPARRPSVFSMVLATIVGIGLLAMTVPSIGPTLQAAYADGVRGTFTAVDLRCVNHAGHEACSWYGSFQAGADTVPEVYLYGSDRDMLHAGQRTAAVDVGRGNRVYGPGGSREWIFVGLLTLAGLGLLGFAGWAAVGLGRRRPE